MQTGNPENPLRAASVHVERVCALLRNPSPEALDCCCGALQDAAEHVLSWRAGGRGPSALPNAVGEALQLRAALRRAAILLQKAGEFHAGWNRVFSSMTGGYGPGGSPARALAGGRVFLRG